MKNKNQSTLGKFIIELVEMIAIAFVIVIPIRYFLFQPFYVKGASMEPSFHNNDYLIVDEISYRFGEPKRGDIIVFKYPKDQRMNLIKRIIGLPGETIKISNGKITIYNKDSEEGILLKESYLSEKTLTCSFGDESEIKLRDDEFYGLGDNRENSEDSRIFGPIKKDLIIGKVLLRGWPPYRIGIMENPQYASD